MSPDDEPRIERYVRRPGTMGAEERRAVERLIEDDPGAAAYAEFLRSFYERLDADAGRAPDRVETFVDDLFGGNPVISVQPFRPSREARPTVLAAETAASSEERRFSVLATLAAEADQVLVRVVADREAEQGRLYVLAEPPARRAHVVVSFPDLGLDLVTDEEGRLEFGLPANVTAEQWADARAVVRCPVATGELAPSSSATLSLPSGGTVRCRRDTGTLSATPKTGDVAPPSLLTVSGTEAAPHLLRLYAGEAAEHEAETASALILRVYE
jgi:hypothetical protein